MPSPEVADQSYLDGLLQAYEAEIAGETYFKALTGVFSQPDQREKLMLLAEVEQKTWQTLQPVIERHRLEPTDHVTLAAQGRAHVKERAFKHWNDLMENMTTRYPAFIEKFIALEAMGPDEDKHALKLLTRHEVALLAFAEQEAAGDENSLTLVRAYLTDS